MEFLNNPFDLIIQATKELYPQTQALIQFNPMQIIIQNHNNEV